MKPDTVSLKFTWEKKGPRIARALENDGAMCFTSERQLQVRNLKTVKPHSLGILESRKPPQAPALAQGHPSMYCFSILYLLTSLVSLLLETTVE